MRRVNKNERPRIALTLNGRKLAAEAEPRMLLSDFLRQGLGSTGTHVGCEHGICGACTVLIDGVATRSCLTLAVQAENREVRTVELLAAADGKLNALQQAFGNNHALQCGFCTPGILMSFTDFLARNPHPSEAEIRDSLERPPLPLHRLRRHRRGDQRSSIRPRDSGGGGPREAWWRGRLTCRFGAAARQSPSAPIPP